MKALPLLALLATGCAAGRGWSRADTAAQLAFAATIAVDESQTVGWITPHCMEANPIIGPCGERMPAPLYMASAMALETVIAWSLPPSWRRWFEGAAIGAEGDVIFGNWITGRETGASRSKP